MIGSEMPEQLGKAECSDVYVREVSVLVRVACTRNMNGIVSFQSLPFS